MKLIIYHRVSKILILRSLGGRNVNTPDAHLSRWGHVCSHTLSTLLWILHLYIFLPSLLHLIHVQPSLSHPLHLHLICRLCQCWIIDSILIIDFLLGSCLIATYLLLFRTWGGRLWAGRCHFLFHKDVKTLII